MQPLSAGERAAIEDAISRAEKETSGEIVVLVTRASARYFATGLMWAALAALSVPLPLIWLTNLPVEHIYLVQLAVFALGVALIQWEPFRFALVPKSVKRARAHERAVEQFVAQNLHTTKGRTRRAYLRVLRRGFRWSDCRQRHLRESPAGNMGAGRARGYWPSEPRCA